MNSGSVNPCYSQSSFTLDNVSSYRNRIKFNQDIYSNTHYLVDIF